VLGARRLAPAAVRSLAPRETPEASAVFSQIAKKVTAD
jgi:hypothetical protein